MKARLLKMGVTLFLVAVMVAAGVLSSHTVKLEAAAKSTTYNVVLQKGSPTVVLTSINKGAIAPQVKQNEGISFQMQVEAKVKTEKLKTGPASYYPVTIIAKSWKVPTSEFIMPGGSVCIASSVMKGNSKGKLYISGGDVDVSSVQGEKKVAIKIGDGKVDPAGSLIIPITTTSNMAYKDTGKNFMSSTSTTYFTTGQSYIIVKGSKTKLEGKALPTDDTTGLLPKPLVGTPLNLDAGTGTLVGSNAVMNVKNKLIGVLDYLTGQYWVMKITHAS